MTERMNGAAAAVEGRFSPAGHGDTAPGKLFMDYVAEDFLPHARGTEKGTLLLTETRAKALVWEFGDLPLSEIARERIAAFRARSEARTPPAIVDRYVELLERILDHAAAGAGR